MKIYAIKRNDGSVSIIKIYDGKSTIEKELDKWDAKDRKTVVSWREIQESDIPNDRTYRSAWTDDFDTKTIDVHPDKKHEIDIDNVRKARADEYPDVGDQLDAILKFLTSERFQGEDLPQDLDNIIGQWTAVKKKHPKPEKEGTKK